MQDRIDARIRGLLEAAEAFKGRADKLGVQYARFEAVPGVHIDAGLAMGESIADLSDC
jgi:predicted metalloendopeptidase